jgi:hypothetical protein
MKYVVALKKTTCERDLPKKPAREERERGERERERPGRVD